MKFDRALVTKEEEVMMIRTIGSIIGALCFLAVAIGFFVAGPGQYTLGVLLSGALFFFCIVILWRSFQQKEGK
jgi:hypothetical protein